MVFADVNVFSGCVKGTMCLHVHLSFSMVALQIPAEGHSNSILSGLDIRYSFGEKGFVSASLLFDFSFMCSRNKW